MEIVKVKKESTTKFVVENGFCQNYFHPNSEMENENKEPQNQMKNEGSQTSENVLTNCLDEITNTLQDDGNKEIATNQIKIEIVRINTYSENTKVENTKNNRSTYCK